MIPNGDELANIESGRERMILAAAKLLVAADGTVLSGGLKQKLIAELAGQHPSNFGHHFEGLAEVLGELGVRFQEVVTQAETSEAIIEQLLESFTGDLARVLRTISDAHFEQSMEEGDRVLQLTMWALLHNDPDSRQMLLAMIAQPNPSLTGALSSALQRWGLEMRPPWDIETLAAVFRALVDGLTVQASMDEDVGHLLGLTVLSLYPMVTRFTNDPARTVDEAIAGFSTEAAAHWRDSQEGATAVDSDTVFRAVQSQLSKRGYNALSLHHVGLEAGIPARQISLGMGDLDHLICEAFRRQSTHLADEFDFDAKSGLFGCEQMVRRQLDRLGVLTRDAVQLTRAVMAMMTGGGAASEVAEELCVELGEDLVKLLTEAKANGELVDDVVPMEAARALLLGVMLRASLRPSQGSFPLDLVAPLFRTPAAG